MEKRLETQNGHERYMQRAIDLAELAEGFVSPNPMVGAVLRYQDRIIGEGWHQAYGGPHAEVHAINSVGDSDHAFISLSTIYITLEPCFHFGKTPPCVDLILRTGIKKVVIAQEDPNPLTAGKSVEKLRAAGVNVVVGIMEKEAVWLNRAFLYTMKTGKPYLILKWAETPQAVMGSTKKRLHISSPETRYLVHQWRLGSDAILVGKATAQNDKPTLDLRFAQRQKPLLRIAYCTAEQLEPTDPLLNDLQATWLIGSSNDQAHWTMTTHKPEAKNHEILMQNLIEHKKAIVLIEGGADTLSRYLALGNWNEIRRIRSNIMQEGDIYAPAIPPSANLIKTFRLNTDVIEIYTNETTSL
jgi:diaminohydroxyphosphoribosylaminopyrimidine deaminase / 5-amino-6-(5-phosphoribosylamino)uracil reductase